MGRTTKQLSGGGKDKFLRAAVSCEPAMPADMAQRLGDLLCSAVADLRVRREAWAPAGAAFALAKPTVAAEPSPGPQTPSTALSFDPFCFSALAILSKQGAAALLEKLAAIAATEQLQALAKAQHLSVDPTLADASTLRTAIVAATESRLQERRAAAS